MINPTLGEYPYLSLKEAREKRDDLKRGMERGVDPKATLHPPEAMTFKKVATEWYEKNIHGIMSEKRISDGVSRELFRGKRQ